MPYLCSTRTRQASQRCSTDDKPRAMSNLFEHCRGAKEEEISWSSNVRVVFLYAYDRKNTIWQTLYRRTDSLRRIPRGWPSCIRLSLRQLAGWAIVEHPITKTGIVEKKEKMGWFVPTSSARIGNNFCREKKKRPATSTTHALCITWLYTTY